MKHAALPICLLAILAGHYLTGCAGGSVQDPPPASQHPGQGWGAASPSDVQYVESKGQVLLMTPNGASTPLAGVRLNVVADGVNIHSTMTDQRGVYSLRLKKGRRNSITSNKPGYQLNPESTLITPTEPEILPVIEARIRGIQIPASGNQVSATTGGESPSHNSPGMVIGRISADPATGAVDTLLDMNVLIRDAATHRVIRSVRTNNQNMFAYQGQVGQEIIVEPPARGRIHWYPSSRRIRLTRQQQEVTFQWRADERHASPSARPSSRPVNRRPMWIQPNP